MTLLQTASRAMAAGFLKLLPKLDCTDSYTTPSVSVAGSTETVSATEVSPTPAGQLPPTSTAGVGQPITVSELRQLNFLLNEVICADPGDDAETTIRGYAASRETPYVRGLWNDLADKLARQ